MQLFRVSLLPLLFLYAYQVTGYGSDKEGKCPPKPADINCTLVKLLPPERQCFQDLECNEGEKCCEIGCDRYVCTPAIDLPVVPVIGPCSFNDSSGKGDCQKKNVTFCDKDDCTKCCHHSSTCSPQPGVYIEKEECGKVQCQKKECYGQGRICIMDKYHRAKCTCPQGCPKDYVGEPICGSDNIDYDNECEMNLTACVLGGMITIKNKGSCKDCSAGKARGYGEEIMVRWNYDQFRGVCSPFLYHGNGGNTNNFETRKECEKYCAHRVKNVCQLPKVVGVCRQSIPRWYFNKARGACEKFIYGGCFGNANNFKTLEDCRDTCTPHPCGLPKETGDCRAYFPNFYYNSTTKLCEPFVYGGCGGNANRFGTIDECVSACGDEQSIPGAPGTVPTKPCPEACVASYQPVCGSNDQTYPNLCVMHADACRKGVLVIKKKDGPCESEPEPAVTNGGCSGKKCDYGECVVINGTATCQCRKACPFIYLPVCGSDKQSYDNMCLLDVAACDKKQNITVLYEGKCDEPIVTGARCLGENKFTCRSIKKCIPLQKKCDGIDDCGDNSDEEACETKCEKEVREANEKQPIVGLYIPQCEDDGSYKEIQCHGSIGECWCVDDQGVEVDGTRVNNRVDNKQPECGQKETKCEKEVREANEKQPIVGLYIPQCEDDGSYKDIQCHGSIGECWCVDDQGVEVDGTRVNNRVDNKQPECGKKGTNSSTNLFDICEISLCDFGSCVVRNGSATCECFEGCTLDYNPVCASNNVTYPNYCAMELDACKKKERLSMQYEAECGSQPDSKATKCQLENKVKAIPGRYIPQCEDDGSYKRKQCHGSTGQCWCVDTDGNKLAETVVNFTQPNCEPTKGVTTATTTNEGTANTVLFGDECDRKLCEFGHCVDINGVATCQCEQPCTRIVLILCGTDNVTYDNYCTMEVAACKQKKHIAAQYLSKCGSKPQTKCEKHREKAQNAGVVAGRFIPSCEEDGSYSTAQCHGSTGFCWCSDDQGNEIDNTRVRFKLPLCNASRPVDPCSSKECKQGHCVNVNGVAQCQCYEQCSDEMHLACGTDNKTYYNPCYLKVKNCKKGQSTSVQYMGPCYIPPIQPVGTHCQRERQIASEIHPKRVGDYIPQCKEDGKYFKKQCRPALGYCWCVNEDTGVKVNGTQDVASKVNCQQNSTVAIIDYDICEITLCDYGRCVNVNGKAVCQCRKGCPKILRPVCGTDGKTYDNICLLEVEACEQKKRTGVDYEGPCKGGENSISKPDVCATVKCRFGRCVEINGSAVCNCELPCPRLYDPYCGSDNKTYDNKCILAVESCKQKKTITIQYRGRCDPCLGVDCQYNSKCQVVEGKAKCQCQLQCPANIDWKCGSDGKLYSNECELKHAACTNMKNIDIVDITKCQERDCQACPSVSEISIEKRYCRTKNDFAIIGKVVSLAKYTSYYELNVTVKRRFKPRQPSKKVTLKRDETITIKFSPIAPDCRCKDIEKLVVNTKAIFIGQLDGDGNTVVAMKPSSFVQVVRKGLVQKLWRLKSTKGRSICRRFSL